jgi:hypothetical protein
LAPSGDLGVEPLSDSIEVGVSEIGGGTCLDALEEMSFDQFVLALLILTDQCGDVLADRRKASAGTACSAVARSSSETVIDRVCIVMRLGQALYVGAGS